MRKLSILKPFSVSLGQIVLGMLLGVLGGCAHLNSRDSASVSPEALPLPKSLVAPNGSEGNDSGAVVTRLEPNQCGELIVLGKKLKNTKFDIPITINSRVELWVEYFSGKGRGFFQKYLERSEFFIPYIVPILRQNKLPEDLVYLAMIESGFNNFARSQARAVGPWQFIPETGRRYGLQVNWWIDERRDIKKSTLSAVGYLRDLYSIFQNWELAAAAYNSGEAKIARAIRRFGIKDFWVLSRQRFLKPETRDYVPKIIAAAILSKNRAQFGFPEKFNETPEKGQVIAGDGEMVKVVVTDPTSPDVKQEFEQLADQNADEGLKAFLNSQYPGDKLIAQSDQSQDLMAFTSKNNAQKDLSFAHGPGALQNEKIQVSQESTPIPHMTKKGVVGGEQIVEFMVNSPVDLLAIARAAGISYLTVKSLNPEILRWCTPPDQKTYQIKLPSFSGNYFMTNYNSDQFPKQLQFLVYKAKKGETLHQIAKKHSIRPEPLVKLNPTLPVHKLTQPLKPGESVILPLPRDASRNLASLELTDPVGSERRRSRRQYKKKFLPLKVQIKQRELPKNAFLRAKRKEFKG